MSGASNECAPPSYEVAATQAAPTPAAVPAMPAAAAMPAGRDFATEAPAAAPDARNPPARLTKQRGSPLADLEANVRNPDLLRMRRARRTNDISLVLFLFFLGGIGGLTFWLYRRGRF